MQLMTDLEGQGGVYIRDANEDGQDDESEMQTTTNTPESEAAKDDMSKQFNETEMPADAGAENESASDES